MQKSSDSLILNTLENCKSFALEAVTKARSAENDLRGWKFAIINVVQAIELALKELLIREHPVLVFNDIDCPKHTVDIGTAIKRIEKIAKQPLLNRDKKTIEEAQKIRNEILHFKTNLSIDKTRVLFSQLFAFLDHFHIAYLGGSLLTELPYDLLEFVVKNKQFASDLREKAAIRIESEKIDKAFILPCEVCGSDTFVTQDDIDRCYLCGHEEDTEACKACENPYFKSYLKDFSSEFDYDVCESRSEIKDNFGYNFHSACVDCYDSIVEDIKQKRDYDRFYYMELEREYARECRAHYQKDY